VSTFVSTISAALRRALGGRPSRRRRCRARFDLGAVPQPPDDPRLSALAALCFGTHYLLLGSTTAAIACSMSLLQSVAGYSDGGLPGSARSTAATYASC